MLCGSFSGRLICSPGLRFFFSGLFFCSGKKAGRISLLKRMAITGLLSSASSRLPSFKLLVTTSHGLTLKRPSGTNTTGSPSASSHFSPRKPTLPHISALMLSTAMLPSSTFCRCISRLKISVALSLASRHSKKYVPTAAKTAIISPIYSFGWLNFLNI